LEKDPFPQWVLTRSGVQSRQGGKDYARNKNNRGKKPAKRERGTHKAEGKCTREKGPWNTHVSALQTTDAGERNPDGAE